jgi:gluconate 5-dehydrogenase
MHVRELFDLRGRVAIVTGGSRGLGLAIARALGEAGAAVAISARREQWLGPARDELTAAGLTVYAALCDVSQPEQVEQFVAAVAERFGRLDILVNNAGVSWGTPALEMPLDRWRQVLETNLTGAFLMCQAVGRRLVAAGRGGRVLNVASIAGLVGTDPEIMDAIGYTASKGALIALTRDLAVKWARHGITVNAIAPSFIETRMAEPIIRRHADAIRQAVPLGRIGTPDDVKGVALFLCSDAAAYITGQIIAVDGGMTAR